MKPILAIAFSGLLALIHLPAYAGDTEPFGVWTFDIQENIQLADGDDRKDRRDERGRSDERQDKRDCRQEEGRVGKDKRDCKQEEARDGVRGRKDD